MRLFLLNLVVVAGLLSSCNAGEVSDETSAVAARQDAVSAGPQSLSTWRWGSPFFPSTSKSAYLVAIQHPNDPNSFVAWGFDVVTGRTLFFVTGSNRSDLGRMLAQVAADISVAVQLDVEFTHHIAEQVGKKGPGQPPSPGTDWTQMNAYGWNIAMKLQAAHVASF